MPQFADRRPNRWVSRAARASGAWILVLLLGAFAGKCAAGPLRVVRPAAETGDVRFDYYWNLLDRALALTQADFGPYELRQAEAPSNEPRTMAEVESGAGPVNIIVHGNVLDYETRLLPIRMPLDKGVLGYRVFLIRADTQPLFDRVNSLEDLRRYSIGQGRGWGDIEILRRAGLKVVEGGGYNGLFRMLSSGRFDLLCRSTTEAIDEFVQHPFPASPLAVERHLLLYYPLTRYFFVRRSPDGEALAARIAAGLARMRGDGSFEQLFAAYLAPIEAQIHFRERALIRIDNPLLTPQTPLGDKSLWYDPLHG